MFSASLIGSPCPTPLWRNDLHVATYITPTQSRHRPQPALRLLCLPHRYKYPPIHSPTHSHARTPYGHIHEPRCHPRHPQRTASRALPICGAATMICCMRCSRSEQAAHTEDQLPAATYCYTYRSAKHGRMHSASNIARLLPPLRADDLTRTCSDAASVHSRPSGNSRARAMRWMPPMPCPPNADLPTSDRERRDALLAVISRPVPCVHGRTHAAEHAALTIYPSALRGRPRVGAHPCRPGARGDRGTRSARSLVAGAHPRARLPPRVALPAPPALGRGSCFWIFFPPSRRGAAANRTGADPRKSWIGGPALG